MPTSASVIKLITASVIASTFTIGAASAQQNGFAHNEVELIIPYGPGGGSSLHGRVVASALEKTLPGNPKVIINNIPGAGSVRGINEFDSNAKPDGSTVASIASGTYFSYIVDNPAVRYALPEFNAFLGSPFGVIVYARKDQAGGLGDDPVQNIQKLQQNPPAYGGQNATSSDMPALLALDLLDIEPRTLFGVSNNEAQAAFNRGELTINYDNMASWESAVEPLIEEGTAEPLFTFGYVNEEGEIERDPKAPDVPTFTELYEEIHGEPLAGTAKDTWMAMMAIRVMGAKMFVLPKGTSQEIIDTYSQAACKAQEELLKTPEALQVLGPYPQLCGSAAQRTMLSAAKFSEEQKSFLRDWLKSTYEVEF